MIPIKNTDALLALADFMVERQNIWYRKEIEKRPAPWTDDPVLRKGHFTNIYRECDKTTRIFTDMLNRPWIGSDIRYEILQIYNLFVGHYFNDHLVLQKFFPLTRKDNELQDLAKKLHEHRISNRVFTTAILPPKRVKDMDTITSIQKYGEDYYNVACNLFKVVFGLTPWKILKEIDNAPCIGDFRSYEIYLYLTRLDWFPYDEDSVVVFGPGTIETLQLIYGQSNLSYGDAWDLRNILLDILIEKKFIFLDNEGSPLNGRPVSECKFTLRCVEGSLCEYRKYLKIKETGRILRPYATFGSQIATLSSRVIA